MFFPSKLAHTSPNYREGTMASRPKQILLARWYHL